MASLSEMRAAVNEQRNIKYELENQLNELTNGIYRAENSWNELTNAINTTLSNGAARTKNSHQIALDAYELQIEIEKQYANFKNIELANKKIRACRNKIYYEFANYRAVRKIVQAMLNNIEISFVHDSTLYKAVEIKHLQLPDYWLTCALLAIMAWRNDDRDMAERALARACKLDKKNASMFFFAFHLRIGKNETAFKWFAEYTRCERTGEDDESILLLFAIADRTVREECSDEVISGVNRFIRQIIDDQLHENDYSENDVVEKILRYLYGLRHNSAFEYPLLNKYCTEKDLLNDLLISARANEKILDFILQTVNLTTEEKNDFLHRHIDTLIAKANKTERDTVDEIRRNELIIKQNGNVQAAEKIYEEEKRHDENRLNIINEMVDWVYTGELRDTNPTVQKTMFRLTGQYTAAAAQRYTDGYRRRFKRTLGIKINEYASVADLGSPGSEDAKIDAYFHEKAAKLAAAFKMWPAYVAFGLAALAVVGAVMVQPVLAVAAVIGLIAGGVIILVVNKRKKNCHITCEAEARSTKDIMAQLSQEFARYENEFRQYDYYYNGITEELRKLQ